MQIPNFLSSIPDNPPGEVTLTQDNFSRGVITLVNESKLPKNALKEARNLTLAEDGAPTLRPGVAWYGTAPSANPIDGAKMFVMSDDTTHIVVVAGGQIWRSINDGVTWSLCQTALGVNTPFTAGKKAAFEQANAYFFIFNGWDNIVRYDGTTTLQTYTALSAPVANTPTKTGLGGAAYTYRYRVSAVNDIGYTIASDVIVSGAGWIQTDRTRDKFDASNYVTFTWGAVVGAVRYDIYVGQIAGEETYIDSVSGQATTTYVDQGAAIEQVAVVAPTTNTTQGPRCGDMAMVGTRLFATQDRDFPYRVWISGAGRFIGQFSSAYDATYIDLQKGSQFKPMTVKDYRDGKGTPLATVWCRSKDGLGCIWQGSLDSMTVGDITFPVPNFYKLPGSRGTDAPWSVVNVLNDYMYYNSQAFFNLGSRAQFLNLLSTDEASANIRPNIKTIRQSAAGKIAAHFQDAKVYFSVPYNSDTNNYTAIYDTERKAWIPEAFTIGFERFFTYTDNTSNSSKHMLAWKPGDTQLSEISSTIKGDYGVPFITSLITGLNHINPKNRFDFLFADEGQIEVASPSGQITVELSGITREDGFKKILERNIQPVRTKRSWGLNAWTTHVWTYVNSVAVNYSEPSTKRYFSVQEEINAYQYRITTATLDAGYVFRTLQLQGTMTDAGKPPNWELFT